MWVVWMDMKWVDEKVLTKAGCSVVMMGPSMAVTMADKMVEQTAGWKGRQLVGWRDNQMVATRVAQWAS